jgi:hypothetical protein
LQGNFRPIEGGVRIQNADRVTCTMMATAYHRGQGKKGLLMNSHCTQSQFAVDNVNVYQPGGTFFSNDYVAKEVIDPAPNASLPGCPTGRRCRLSEAAFAEFDTSTVGIVGKIAKPALRCGNSICDTAINSTAEVLTITGVAATHVVADSREKIGQYSGWTSGRISRTCVDVNVKDTNITLLCQHEVATCGGPGDSGAPVFQRTQGDNVILAGIVWGGPDDGTSFSYSPISAIEAELGTMDFHE